MPGGGGGGDSAGGGGLGRIWGADPTTPGPTASWTESTRLLVAVGAFAAILLAAGLLIFGVLKGGNNKAADAQKTNRVTKFVPATSSDGGKTVLAATFSDGTTAELLYGPSLKLAELGLAPSDSGSLGKFVRLGGQFQIDHGGASFVLNESPTPAPPGLPAAGGSSVPLLPAATPTPGNFLDFKAGDWRVGVWEGVDDDKMSAADNQAWAANMSVTQTASGFVVLTGKAPVKLTPFGATGGPSLVFGDIFTTGVVLIPGSCVPPVGTNVFQNAHGVPARIARTRGDHYEGDLCLKDQKMEALIYGTQDFVKGISDTLEVRNIKPGPARV